jgi:hypothetical protein
MSDNNKTVMTVNLRLRLALHMTVDTIPQRKHSLILHYCNTARQLSTVVRYLFVIKKFD